VGSKTTGKKIAEYDVIVTRKPNPANSMMIRKYFRKNNKNRILRSAKAGRIIPSLLNFRKIDARQDNLAHHLISRDKRSQRGSRLKKRSGSKESSSIKITSLKVLGGNLLAKSLSACMSTADRVRITKGISVTLYVVCVVCRIL
jgi:hypothetical protein